MRIFYLMFVTLSILTCNPEKPSREGSGQSIFERIYGYTASLNIEGQLLAASTPEINKESLGSAKNYARHLKALLRKMPKGFTVLLEKPFVVIGDEPEDTVRRRAVQTIRWAVRRLKSAYFSKDPADIINIWLFKDNRSYRYYAKFLFNHTPDTPYGYYSETFKALVMNIATGGGTLVHEIVHPFMKVNFPNCPTWLNEGLGSLYEQCADHDGQIWGLTNWRLSGLQRAIRKGGLPSFKTLMSMTSSEFYDDQRGSNYAQARYLCYYLQEKGLLFKYYHQFRRNQVSDPSGYKTLQALLKESHMSHFKKRWEQWVLGLRFNE